MPVMAGAIARSRNPAEIAYAQSAPGTMTSENDKSQKTVNKLTSTA